MAAPAAQTVDDVKQQVVLETPRLILRAAQSSDAVLLYEAFSDPEVMRYWSTPPHSSLSKTQAWVTSMTTSSQNGITDFIIILKHPPTSTTTLNPLHTLPIGKIGIYRPPPSNEIGFMISRSHWGKGLAREAATCMLDYLFSLPAPPLPAISASNTTNNGATVNETPNETHSYTTLTPTEQQAPWCYASISADVDPRNEGCKVLLGRMGFVEVGVVEKTDCIGGEWVDSVCFKLEREGWMSRG